MPPSILGKFPYSRCWMSVRPSTRSTILSCWSAFPNLTVSPARPTGGSSHLYRSVDRPFDSGVPRHRLPWFVSVYPRAQSSAQSCTFSIRPMSPHLWIVESFGLRVHLYADDTQLYGFSSPDDSAALADLIRRAIDSVSEWMASNRLLLNGDKTQYIWFGTKQQLGKRDVQRLTDISPALTSTSVVRNLGVLLDSELTMVNHVTKLCQVCFFPTPTVARGATFAHTGCDAHTGPRLRLLPDRLLQ